MADITPAFLQSMGASLGEALHIGGIAFDGAAGGCRGYHADRGVPERPDESVVLSGAGTGRSSQNHEFFGAEKGFGGAVGPKGRAG